MTSPINSARPPYATAADEADGAAQSAKRLAASFPAIDSARPAAGEPSEATMSLWRKHGGGQHGPHVETVTMPMHRFDGFLVEYAALRAAAATRTDQEIPVAWTWFGPDGEPAFSTDRDVMLRWASADGAHGLTALYRPGTEVAKAWAEVKTLRAELDATEARERDLAKTVEWAGTGEIADGGYEACCPLCEWSVAERQHAPDCRLAAAIRALPIADRPDQSEGGGDAA